ncbi:hypothetical protein [Thiomicrorhabdus sp.]|uniref:hypothetical protein n=1 Tax=Thiomicrorhabdus sp. TaxID=2039724 RepID=UPI0029C68E12|nr:hypothetical protein [Thiomicrorhabdus sp.]
MSKKEILIVFLVFVPTMLILVKTGAIQSLVKNLNEPTPLEVYDLKVLKNIQVQTILKGNSGIEFQVKNQNEISVKNLILECQYLSETGIELSEVFEQKLLYLFPKNNLRKLSSINTTIDKPEQAGELVCKVRMFEISN